MCIKVQDGPLTSKLQHIQVGDKIVVGKKPTGTLLIDYLLPAKNLYLLGSGTGLAPFMCIIRDPATYERFEKVILVHGVREVKELAYHDYIQNELPEHEFLGEMISQQLLYYPTVTREPFRNQGRITTLIETGKLEADLGLPKIDPVNDRIMICGSPGLNKDIKHILEARGFVEGSTTSPGDYVVERAFVESEATIASFSEPTPRTLRHGTHRQLHQTGQRSRWSGLSALPRRTGQTPVGKRQQGSLGRLAEAPDHAGE
jgi:ferredoxin--NADP+ reductase